MTDKATKGTSVIVIKHNNEVMKRTDYLIDVRPDGGRDGGRIVFTGPPGAHAPGRDQHGNMFARCRQKPAIVTK